mmetsp:Transcript_13360/g.17625  ORF Transcript_13360/g.17625 Transcript_13360/m.17625 type:complete len:400 (+) Transcript_13360:138-1337(+)|eukprot:CAMPEP_0117759560 /NCGR_PEP_ID=MMETSP0947-20121206/16087_1 /TAXON_ID=44440 /ORGANISM="Chattonella subsalsa, Strain CCMP2191" /LENGTH=399 /DNA_ID=CAMNT_0005580043 /DNA_START=96 /DNA_END=1295 /DNA_ORIENTATION=+
MEQRSQLPSQGGVTSSQIRQRRRQIQKSKSREGTKTTPPSNHSTKEGENYFRKQWKKHVPDNEKYETNQPPSMHQKSQTARAPHNGWIESSPSGASDNSWVSPVPSKPKNGWVTPDSSSSHSNRLKHTGKGKETKIIDDITGGLENLSMQASTHKTGNQSNFELYSSQPGPSHQKRQQQRKKKNTTCFDPCHKPADMRVLFGGTTREYPRRYKVRDVVVAPSILCEENDLTLYSQLLEEIQASGSHSLFVPWHGDSHLIANDRDRAGKWKEDSSAFRYVIQRIEEYFKMDVKATRFNWYRDSSEWKPFHHDAAAIKPEFAKTQNCTVAASLGAERDVTFQHARTGTTVTTPLPNGSLYAFGRDVNIQWKHGIPQLPPEEKSSQGRVSIIAWGWVEMDEV